MIVQYCSDLHLEFNENKNYLINNPLKPVGNVLLLAGDVVTFASMDKQNDFFDYVSDHFERTYWVPGNHEYYHADLAERSGAFVEKIRSNVLLVNNHTETYNGARFIFSTLWTHLNENNKWNIQNSLSDFHVIKYHNERLTPDDYNRQHAINLEYITKQLAHTHDNTIIVTHHVPTLLNYPEQYKGDVLNDAFAVELFDLIEESAPDYWIYGHHHQNIPAFKIGNTNMLTNQLGYVSRGEHELFNAEKAISL